MEALIAADIRVFNARYNCVCEVPADPTTIRDPANFLKNATLRSKLQYDEGHCAALLSEVDYETLLATCRYLPLLAATSKTLIRSLRPGW